MRLMDTYDLSVTDIAKEIRTRGAVADFHDISVDLAYLVFPEKADTASLFLSVDLDKHTLDLCLIDDGQEDPVYPPISYDKVELDLLLAFVYFLLDEVAA